MWKTALFLILSLLIIPYCAIKYDTPLNDLQQETLGILLKWYLYLAGACFLISTLSRNYSQVDKLWSIAPIIYAWIVVVKGEYDLRLVVMACLVTLWGLRLSYNFARRGGYSWKFWEGDEDYRWKVLQAKPEFKSRLVWSLFNLFFISLYQMGLILLFTLPILKSMNGRPFGSFDVMISVIVLLFIFLETIADQQQWRFYAKKNELMDSQKLQGTEYEKGFNDQGLWSIVRHPNYAAEQGIWIAFYLFSVSATGSWINWSIAGCILLILLFKGSSDFSENISKSKYPDYQNYIERVPRFIPFIKSR